MHLVLCMEKMEHYQEVLRHHQDELQYPPLLDSQHQLHEELLDEEKLEQLKLKEVQQHEVQKI